MPELGEIVVSRENTNVLSGKLRRRCHRDRLEAPAQTQSTNLLRCQLHWEMNRCERIKRTSEASKRPLIPWLLNGDPAIRWQALRDLAEAPERAVKREQRKHRPQRTTRGRARAAAARLQGKTYFEMERVGAPSRWNTLRSLRVLKWWDRVA